MAVIGVTFWSACALNHLRPTFDGMPAAVSHGAGIE